MSHDYHESIFSFSNGFERSAAAVSNSHHEQQQHHIAQQIRREKLRVQGFEAPPPPLVGIDEEESGGLPAVYETAGMLSEMFNFPQSGGGAAELLDQPMPTGFGRSTRPQVSAAEWYGSSRQGMVVGDSKNHQIPSINADSAAAMQLFLMNPNTRSPSPPPPPPPPSSSSTHLHMLLPNPNSNPNQGGGGFGQFSWVPEGATNSAQLHNHNNPNEIGGVVEGQGLSLSLSSSLQHLEAAKAEELRMGESGLLYFNQAANSSGSHHYPYNKNLNLTSTGHGHGHGHGVHHHMHLQGGLGVLGVGMGPHQSQNLNHHHQHQHQHQLHVGFGSSIGVVNALRNSKHVKAAQELLEEFCSVGRGHFKKNKFTNNNNTTNPTSNPSTTAGASSSSKDVTPLSAADRIEHQRRKVKLLSMLDEACNLSPSLFLFPTPLFFFSRVKPPTVPCFFFFTANKSNRYKIPATRNQ